MWRECEDRAVCAALWPTLWPQHCEDGPSPRSDIRRKMCAHCVANHHRWHSMQMNGRKEIAVERNRERRYSPKVVERRMLICAAIWKKIKTRWNLGRRIQKDVLEMIGRAYQPEHCQTQERESRSTRSRHSQKAKEFFIRWFWLRSCTKFVHTHTLKRCSIKPQTMLRRAKCGGGDQKVPPECDWRTNQTHHQSMSRRSETCKSSRQDRRFEHFGTWNMLKYC